MKEIAIIGVPVETIHLKGDNEFDDAPLEIYNRGSTDKIRKYLVDFSNGNANVKLKDLGELKFGLRQDKEYICRNMIFKYEKKDVAEIDLDTLQKERDFVLKQKENFDHVVCIGASHFGALLLYEKNDFVARADFHGDFYWEYEKNYIGENYSSYMHTVKRKIIKNPKKIINYGWGGSYLNDKNKYLAMDIFGEEGAVGDNKHKNTNHFDVDVDCFKKDLEIARSRNCGRLVPKQLEDMISEAKPKKIGIWEYRWNCDKGNGRKFIENVIFKCLIGQR